jgi:DNA polymerase-3 subunit gamma/tau
MSYQVLARKWRPRNFQTLVGQEHILRMLSNALEQKRLHHAYLFTGTRGVGKTTIARILAKCLNCEVGITSTPCGTCHACNAIDAGQFLDLFEIDAASRTKVEDTRELLDNVLYPPTQGRYKIYLIDEVHMLSNHSFNALLKTLEEPPEHVKFLLATTDPKRLPITILSRCLQFHLKLITPELIVKHLQHICTVETIPAEIAALNKLASAADGSLRDALSLLDQTIAYGHGAITMNDVNSMLGSMAHDDLLPLLDALASHNGSQLFKVIAYLAERGPDFQQVLAELIRIFHQIAMLQIVPDALSIDESLIPFINHFTSEEVQLYYQIALLGRRDLPLAATPQQGFEMTMLRILAFKPSVYTQDTAPTPAPAKLSTVVDTIEKNSVETITTVVAHHSIEWRNLLPKLELSGMSYALAANCTLEKMSENKVVLALSINHQPMLNPKLKERIAEALSRHFKQLIQLDIKMTSAELATPVKQKQSEQDQRLVQAKQTIMQDAKVKQFLEVYDATVEVSLI